jgi:hypothetical protein
MTKIQPTTIRWSYEDVDLTVLSLDELDALLDDIIRQASNQENRAESWTAAEWSKRRASYNKFMQQAEIAKEAVEAMLTSASKQVTLAA